MSSPNDIALDANGNLFVTDGGNKDVEEIPYSNGSYGAPVEINSGFNNPGNVAIDGNGRLYVVDLHNIWQLTP